MVQGHRPPGAVADSLDGGIRRARGGVNDDAVGAVQAGPTRERIVGRRPDPDEHGVARNLPAVCQPDKGDVTVDAFE